MVHRPVRAPNGANMAQLKGTADVKLVNVREALGHYKDAFWGGLELLPRGMALAKWDAKHPDRPRFQPINWADGTVNTNAGSGELFASVVAPLRETSVLMSDQVIERLQKKGWYRLGAGASSAVYAHPKKPKIVVKVNSRPDPWPEYILWAAEQGELGKHAPMVYSIAPLKKAAHYWTGVPYVAVMEKLYEMSHRMGCDEALKYPFCKKLRASRLSYHFGWDCYGSNTMERKNGEVVFTDPWCGEPTQKALKPWSFKRWQKTHSLQSRSLWAGPLPLSATVTPVQIPPSTKGHGNLSSTKGLPLACLLGNNAPSPHCSGPGLFTKGVNGSLSLKPYWKWPKEIKG